MVSVAKKDLLGPLALVCAGGALFVYALGRQIEPTEPPTLLGDIKDYILSPIDRALSRAWPDLYGVPIPEGMSQAEWIADRMGYVSPAVPSVETTEDLIDLWHSGGLTYD